MSFKNLDSLARWVSVTRGHGEKVFIIALEKSYEFGSNIPPAEMREFMGGASGAWKLQREESKRCPGCGRLEWERWNEKGDLEGCHWCGRQVEEAELDGYSPVESMIHASEISGEVFERLAERLGGRFVPCLIVQDGETGAFQLWTTLPTPKVRKFLYEARESVNEQYRRFPEPPVAGDEYDEADD